MQYTLRAIRANLNKTQSEVAKDLGIRVETLANYEKGKSSPNIKTLDKLLRYYNVKYDDIKFFYN
jgi:transcriptional regulator with XRE-family HTH domain